VDYELSKHARDAIEERKIDLSWIERAVAEPMRVEPSKSDSSAEALFVKIPECGDRVLRVVVIKQVDPVRVASASFDRSMKGKL
jgi:hypothetical protein